MIASLLPFSVFAQLRVVPDGSTATTISGAGTDCTATCQITGISTAGGNLFHSFSEFSIPSGVVVTFDDGGSNNIFTRVTDPSQASTILGNLSVSGSANFFLINPAGITFGENSSLNLNGGSFIASTAERLTFEDTNVFTAGTPAAPVTLTISAPTGLQFGSTAAPIVNQSRAGVLPSGAPIDNTLGAPAGLRVNPFKTLALLGGDLISVGGNLTALGGNIELGSLEPNSEVYLEAAAQGFDFIYDDLSATQNIQLLGSLIDVGGPGGGQIHLQGNEVTLESSGLFAATFGPIDGGNIGIDAATLNLDDSAV
ncbi:MAG: filamentous hemagglutinin N-terminal domain-containing protein, partial [Cyanobacteria bacterium P01_F01_bin.53]